MTIKNLAWTIQGLTAGALLVALIVSLVKGRFDSATFFLLLLVLMFGSLKQVKTT